MKRNEAEYIEEMRLNNYQKNVDDFSKQFNFFFDKGDIFWIWNKEKYKYEIIDEISLLNMLDTFNSFNKRIVVAPFKSKYIDMLKSIGRENQPSEPSLNWIQFKNKVFDINTNQTFEVTPEYFFINPIPWEIGENEDTPIIDKLFKEWVNEKWVPTLYEMIAYCCYRSYPIHLIFCLYGIGMNGKGQYQKFLLKFLGLDNVCASDLDDLVDNRFSSVNLYKKLLCQMGETNFGIMDRTSLLKQLVGGDLIKFEYKNKIPFNDYNYAKIIINTNSLPSSGDTSEGFYRRWIIIPFENGFEHKCIMNVIDIIPEEEFNNLARKVLKIIPNILLCGRFSGQGTIMQQKQEYIAASNPLPLFIKECCEEGNPETCFVRYSELYRSYVQYLNKQKKRIVGKHEFKQALERECFEIRRTSKKLYDDHFESDNWVEGLTLKRNEIM